MNRLGVAVWVVLAGMLLAGTWFTAQRLDRIEEKQDGRLAALEANEQVLIAQRDETARQLCGLLVVIVRNSDRTLVSQTFRRLGYECEVPVTAVDEEGPSI